MPYPEDLDGGLRKADPLAGTMLETPSIDAALNELGQRLVGVPVSVSRPWTRVKKPWLTRRILAAGVASLLVVSVAGAASFLTARTGQQMPENYVQAGGPGELLRTWAPDFCKVALAISSDITYPPGFEDWRLRVLAFENQIPNPSAIGDCPVTPPGGTPVREQVEVSSGAERGWFAMSAFCAWVSDYVSAKQSGNTSEASAASSEIAGATAWPAVRAEYPHPDAYTVFGFFLPFQRAVLSDNSTHVARMLARPHNVCAAFVPLSRNVRTSIVGAQAGQ